ncbi:preprotein translocase subunit SecG [Allopusillimonas ginsengisoli]|uniref:preprotein translocase subunit SecG n=1 Tax=Allopusillimonas ginsengisoli TaxID=453575 RepID=UPI0010C1D794|nr:preprotein translocase subunit SecG [Allopusillimonas ginsengisoli]
MHWLSSALLAVQVISSLSIIVLVLLQQGKGADMGASFGGGSAGSVFGASGAANFLSRVTKWAAIIFFVSTGGLAWYAHHPAARPAVEGGIMQGFETPKVPSTGADVPVVPSQGEGASVPAAPAAAGTTPQPAASAVPSASDASVPSGVKQEAQSAAGTTSPSAGASGQQNSNAAAGQASQGADQSAQPSSSSAPASGEAGSSKPAQNN